MTLPDFPDSNKWGFSLAALNSCVYVTGRPVGPPSPGGPGSQSGLFQSFPCCENGGIYNPGPRPSDTGPGRPRDAPEAEARPPRDPWEGREGSLCPFWSQKLGAWLGKNFLVCGAWGDLSKPPSQTVPRRPTQPSVW